MTVSRHAHQQASPGPVTDSRAEKDLAETSEPYDPPDPEDYWPSGRPAYLVVVDQLRDWPPGRHSPSLAELLETRPGRTREPEPEPEAEP